MTNNLIPIAGHAPYVDVRFGSILDDERNKCFKQSALELYSCNTKRRMKIYIELLASWCDSIKCRVVEWNRNTKLFDTVLLQPFQDHTADKDGFIVINRQNGRKESSFILNSLKTQDWQMYALEIDFPASQDIFLQPNCFKVFGTVNGKVTLERRTTGYMDSDGYKDAMKFNETKLIHNSYQVTEKKIRKRPRSSPNERPKKKAKAPLEESQDKRADSSINIRLSPKPSIPASFIGDQDLERFDDLLNPDIFHVSSTNDDFRCLDGEFSNDALPFDSTMVD